jgi:hypothetical protein
MRRRARTDLCGGRSVMFVPTATATCSCYNCLCPFVHFERVLWLALWPQFGAHNETYHCPSASPDSAVGSTSMNCSATIDL